MTLADGATPPTITVTTGPAAGSSVQIDRDVVIGRENCDLNIADPELSRRHAVLRSTGTGVVIEDLTSLNGTFVNDQRISTPTSLSPDDRVRVGGSWLKVVIPTPPPPPAADPTPIADVQATHQRPVPATPDATPVVETETTRQRPVPATPDPTPIVDTETTRQRPVPATPDPTPIVDTETTRQRPVPATPDPTPIVDTETTRQRPVPATPDPTSVAQTDTTRQRPIPATPDPTPIVDTESTRQRPTPDAAGWEGTRVRETPVQGERTTVSPAVAEPPPPPAPPDAQEADADAPPPGRRGLPASTVTIIAVIAIIAAIGIGIASSSKGSKSTHQFSATIRATPLRATQLGQTELTGALESGLLGSGATTIDEFVSVPGPSGAPGSQLLSAQVTTHLSAGTLVSVVKAGVTPVGRGGAIAGTGTITGGTSRYKNASGSYSITGTQASAGSATIFTLHGSVRY